MAGKPGHQVLFYEYVEDIVRKRAPYRKEHLALIRTEKEAGRVVMAGALGDPVHGAAIVFHGVERGSIERFVDSDPFVREGLVTTWRIEPWSLV